ncbi:MipA/OmpV family protein [Roseateles sp. DB2]|uniref:MipA/OmpV family protein n=1 Tax=Roseateles sp. DB2 TaxID=3453717 RepID=UPI003EEC4CD2
MPCSLKFTPSLSTLARQRPPSAIGRAIAAIGIALGALPLLAQAESTPVEVAPAHPGWSGTVFLGAVVAPRYQGSQDRRVLPGVGMEFSYHDADMGTVSLGNRGLLWAPVLPPSIRVQLGLEIDPGRVDSDKRKLGLLGYRPGSATLKGMGEVRATGVAVATANYALPGMGGLELSVSARQALAAHKGRQLSLGLSYPLYRTADMQLTLAPSLTWADRRYQRAYFGVTEGQAAASGRPQFAPRAGIKSVQLGMEFDMALSQQWRLAASLELAQLRGDAAQSPVTQKTRQLSGMVGVVRPFQF